MIDASIIYPLLLEVGEVKLWFMFQYTLYPLFSTPGRTYCVFTCPVQPLNVNKYYAN